MPGLGFSQEPAPSREEMEEAMNSESSGEELELENIEAMDTGDEPLMPNPECKEGGGAARELKHAAEETLAAIKMSKNVKEKSWTSSMKGTELQKREKEPQRSANGDAVAVKILENDSIGGNTREAERSVQNTKKKGASLQAGKKRKRGRDDRVDGQVDVSKGEHRADHASALESSKPLKKRRKHKQDTVAATSRPVVHSSQHSTAAANISSYSQSARAPPFTGIHVSGHIRADAAERFNKEASPSYDVPLLELRGRPSSDSSVKRGVRASRKGPAKSNTSAVPPSNEDTRRQLNPEKQVETGREKDLVVSTQSRPLNKGTQQPGPDQTANQPQRLTKGTAAGNTMMANAAELNKTTAPHLDGKVSRDAGMIPGTTKAEKNTKRKRAERLERRPVQRRSETRSEPAQSKQVTRKGELEDANGSAVPHGLAEQQRQLKGGKIVESSQTPANLENFAQKAVGPTESASPYRLGKSREFEKLAHPKTPVKARKLVKTRESGKNQELRSEEPSKETDIPNQERMKSAISRDSAEPTESLQPPESARANVVTSPIESAEPKEIAKPRKVSKPKGRSTSKDTSRPTESPGPKGFTVPNEFQEPRDSIGQQESTALQQPQGSSTPNGDVKRRQKARRPWRSKYARKSGHEFRKPQDWRDSGVRNEVAPPAVSKQTKSPGQRKRSSKTGRFQKTKKPAGKDELCKDGEEAFKAPSHMDYSLQTDSAEESRPERSVGSREINTGQRTSEGGQDLETSALSKPTKFDTTHPKNGTAKNHGPALNLNAKAIDADDAGSEPLLSVPTQGHLTSPKEATKYIQALVDYGHMEARDSLMRKIKSAFDEFRRSAESVVQKAKLDAEDVLPIRLSESPTARERALMDEVTQLRQRVSKLNEENSHLMRELCNANELCAAQRVLLEKNSSVVPRLKTLDAPWSPNAGGTKRTLSNETPEHLREISGSKKSKLLDSESHSSSKLKRDRIMSFIRTCEGPVTAKNIASKLGVNERTSRRYLKVLRDSGELQSGSKRAADSSVQYLLRDEQGSTTEDSSSEEYDYVT